VGKIACRNADRQATGAFTPVFDGLWARRDFSHRQAWICAVAHPVRFIIHAANPDPGIDIVA